MAAQCLKQKHQLQGRIFQLKESSLEQTYLNLQDQKANHRVFKKWAVLPINKLQHLGF